MLSPTAFRFFLPFRWGWNHIPHFTTTLLGAYWMRSTLSTRNFGGGRGGGAQEPQKNLIFPQPGHKAWDLNVMSVLVCLT